MRKLFKLLLNWQIVPGRWEAGVKCAGIEKMDEESLVYLSALKAVNESLIEGLEAAVHTMASWDDLSPVRRETMIKALQELVSMSKEAYGVKPPTEH